MGNATAEAPAVSVERAADGTWTLVLPKPADPPQGLQHEQALAIGGVSIPNVLLGGAGAILVAEIAGGIIPQIPVAGFPGLGKAFVLGAAAWGVTQMAPGEIGQAAATFLLFDAARALLPIDEFLRQAFSGGLGGILGQPAPTGTPAGSSHNSHSAALGRLGVTNI